MTLVVTSGRPPFATNSAVKVANLNADLLDGLSAAAFVPAAIDGWHYVGDPGEPAFLNGWVNSEPNPNRNAADLQNAAYRIDNNHVVHIAGRVRDGTGGTIFVLPGAFCPHFSKAFPVDSNGAHALITVARGPTPCSVRVTNASTISVSLDGISYPDASSDILLAGP